MLSFLSDEWINALDAAGSPDSSGSTAPDPTPTGDPVLTIEQRVTPPDNDADTSADSETRGDAHEIAYAVLVYEDAVRVRKGPAEAPDVTFVVDRDTAAAIARGHVSAQSAFMSGDLHLVGEASALVRAQGALQDLADRFATVRDRTIW